MEDDLKPQRAQAYGHAVEREGRAVVADIGQELPAWQSQIAHQRVLLTSGRPTRSDAVAPLILSIANARRLLRTRMQGQRAEVRNTGAVSNLRKALDRALEAAQGLR